MQSMAPMERVASILATRTFFGHDHTRATLRLTLLPTSMNFHVICTDLQLLIEERPEAYKSIHGRPL